MGSAAVAVVGPEGVHAITGAGRSYRWASVTKIVAALTVLDTVWSGELSLDTPAGPPGSTVRHLLAHASGLSFDEDLVLAAPGTRRIYSNVGIEKVASAAALATGEAFADMMNERVLEPLGMMATTVDGSPAYSGQGPIDDLARLAQELLNPQALSASGLAEATSVQFDGLAGVLPGFGRQTPNDFGLGFEIRGHKSPHWTSPLNSPETFGHFGQSGSFLWVDPRAQVACVSLCDTNFDQWAAAAWPELSTWVLTNYA